MSVPKASTVANKFVKEYYTKLQNSPETMKLFYNEKVSSSCCRSVTQLLPAAPPHPNTHTHARAHRFASEVQGRATLAATIAARKAACGN